MTPAKMALWVYPDADETLRRGFARALTKERIPLWWEFQEPPASLVKLWENATQFLRR